MAEYVDAVRLITAAMSTTSCEAESAVLVHAAYSLDVTYAASLIYSRSYLD